MPLKKIEKQHLMERRRLNVMTKLNMKGAVGRTFLKKTVIMVLIKLVSTSFGGCTFEWIWSMLDVLNLKMVSVFFQSGQSLEIFL